MKYLCNACREILTAEDSEAGKMIVCSKCGSESLVPEGLFASGSVIADFRIISHLASGDMGEIYLAEKISSGEKVAIKILSKDHTYDAKFIVSFIHTGRKAIKKTYPHTTKVLAVGEENGLFYYVMEFVEGTSLAKVLQEEGVLSLSRSLQIIKTLAETLAEAWKDARIVHRSIKPDNILLTADGDIKLADFGLERDFLDLASRPDEDRLRLIQYAPPELISDFSMTSLDTRSDIYALGAVFYHAVTGKCPYQNFKLSEIVSGDVPLDIVEARHLNPELPMKISDIIRKMMARNPKERYRDFYEVLDDLNRFSVRDDAVAERDSDSRNSITVKMGAAKRAKVNNLDRETNFSQLEQMRRNRESYSRLVVLGIFCIILLLGIAVALFIKWVTYEPQQSAREMEINIARMKERNRRQDSLYQPLEAGSVERLCRGVVAHCSNEDYSEALHFIEEFSRMYPVNPDFKSQLTGHVQKAYRFFLQFSNSKNALSDIRYYSREHGYCTVISVKDLVITAKNVKGKTVTSQIRTFTHEEYASYLKEVVKRFGLQAEFRSYLLCTGNFEDALNLAKGNKKEYEFFEKVIYGYIRAGLSNASPLEIRQMRMLYGSLDAFQKATHQKK